MDPKDQKILVLDYATFWRDGAARALREAGFEVTTLEDYPREPVAEDGGKFDLVLFAGHSFDEKENQAIDVLLGQGFPVCILIHNIPLDGMRKLFLKGVLDVVSKPYNPILLLELVEEQFELLERPKGSFA